MAVSRFARHISTDIDAKKSSITKSLYRFYAGYTGWYDDLPGLYISLAFSSGNIKPRQVISARITFIKPI